MRFAISRLGSGYPSLLQRMQIVGSRTAPRGIPTLEVIGAQIEIEQPGVDILPTGWGRGVNPAIGIAEAAQLISGTSFPELMVDKFPNFAQFTDGGVWFHGAYGPRIKRQLPKAIDSLNVDADSRQALVTIWDPAYDGYGDVSDSPCTISLQFFNRRDALDMVVYMRSNDVWWGLPYDVFQFTALQKELAWTLGLSQGKYVHNVGSLHLYERDIESANAIRGRRDNNCGIWAWPSRERRPAMTAVNWARAVSDAHGILRNQVHRDEHFDRMRRTLHT